MATRYDYDVVISGYGPTGQAAAALLARRGHRVGVFERWPTLYGLPRLCTLDGEAARIIQAAGDVDHALRDSNPVKRGVYISEEHHVLVELDGSADHVSGFPFRISMYQPDIEDAMDAGARAAGAEIHMGWEITSAMQDDDSVIIRAVGKRTSDPDQERDVRAKFLICADGDGSEIRDALGIEREEWPFRHAWVSIDATRKRTLPAMFSGLAPDLRIPVVVCAPNNKTHAAIPIGASRLRFEILASSPDAAHDEDLAEDVAYRRLEEVFGLTRDDVEIYRQVVFPFKGRLAKQWRVGRILLAGDAAHVMTPFMAQGAGSGLRDAVSLAWRLDLVLRERATDALLESYELERSPHSRAYIEASDFLAALACEVDTHKAEERNKMLMDHPQPTPPDPTLTSGILQRTGGDDILPPVGEQGPQGRIRVHDREGRFDDILGWGFQLIVRGQAPDQVLSNETRRNFENIGGIVACLGNDSIQGTVEDVDGTYGRYFDAHEIDGVLLRPDFNVFGVVTTNANAESVTLDLFDQLGMQVTERLPTAPVPLAGRSS